MKNNDIAVRMKGYEKTNKRYLTYRVPVVLRIDGRAFHTFTKGFAKPFDDEILLKAMRNTMKYLCENISGCVLGYTQSDEITLVLTDYNDINIEPWFGYCQNKLESITASMATMVFNRAFAEAYDNYQERLQFAFQHYDNISGNLAYQVMMEKDNNRREMLKSIERTVDSNLDIIAHKIKTLTEKYEQKLYTAIFDCRAFNIPKDDVCNNLIWRQQDATRNSIQQVGHAYFKHSEIDNLSCDEIQEKLFQEKNINWSKYPTHLKRGSCCVKRPVFISPEEIQKKNPKYNGEGITREKWIIDKEIPIFTQDREYIENLI